MQTIVMKNNLANGGSFLLDKTGLIVPVMQTGAFNSSGHLWTRDWLTDLLVKLTFYSTHHPTLETYYRVELLTSWIKFPCFIILTTEKTNRQRNSIHKFYTSFTSLYDVSFVLKFSKWFLFYSFRIKFILSKYNIIIAQN